MNEINKRYGRQGRFGNIIRRNDMDYCKLGKRNCPQCEQLFLRIMESIHAALLDKEKEHSQG